MARPDSQTLFARTAQGQTLTLGREEGEGTVEYRLRCFDGYESVSEAELRQNPLPVGCPDAFGTLQEAMRAVTHCWGAGAASFEDVRLGRGLELDFIAALREGSLEPLRPRMSASQMVELLGLPEFAQTTMAGVCWFYGSVQIHWMDGTLFSLEIDAGASDFTSLRLGGYFLQPDMARADVEAHLVRAGVRFSTVTWAGLPVIRVPLARDPRQVISIDFMPEDEQLHAMYWHPDVSVLGPRAPAASLD
ncbi:hypothetical protein DRW03_16845 [Corallococcus sp. H22C18031201]|nr:hypothetical protein DRW03_16845 [Corallococcus sp. H22C18031201]